MPTLRLPNTLLSFTCVLLAACGGGGGDGGGDGEADLHVVAAGDVDDHSVVLWSRGARTGSLVFEVSTDPGFGAGTVSSPATVTDVTIPAKVEVNGLTPRTTYHYRVTGPAAAQGLPGTFRTAAAPGLRLGLHFGVGGDVRGDLAPFASIRNAPAMGLDFFVELGDTIYADVPSPAVPTSQATTLPEFRAKHFETLTAHSGLNTIAELRGSTAFFSTIDDHEVTDDFAGGADPATDARFLPSGADYINDTTLFENGLQAFLEYQPVRVETYVGTADPVVEGETKLYRFRTFGDDAALIVLDTRSFRSQMLDNPDPLDPSSIDAFQEASFDPLRTMLGAPQLADVEEDLLSAEAAGITWKFVLVPEPIQNLGPANARDRFEGYAYERSRLLEFIHVNDLHNVVFVAADIHGTVVNNLQYQPTGPDDAQVDIDSFEITTPAIAYDPPLGQDAIESATLTPAEREAYEAMSMDQKDDFFASLLDVQLSDNGYDTTGLSGSTIDATLLEGKWVRAHAWGWCEFAIDATTQVLTITTWGVDPDDGDDGIPFVLNRFTVTPKTAVP